jgi:hypothetical protein
MTLAVENNVVRIQMHKYFLGRSNLIEINTSFFLNSESNSNGGLLYSGQADVQEQNAEFQFTNV